LGFCLGRGAALKSSHRRSSKTDGKKDSVAILAILLRL
jgi:hypothetical protein